jgi:hypothetical protein
MDLEEARKALAKPVAFPWKRVAFLGVAGLLLVAGIALRAGLFSAAPEVEQQAPVAVAAPPPEAAPPAVDAAESVPKTESIPKTESVPNTESVPEAAALPEPPPPAPETAPAPQPPAPAASVEQTEPAEPLGEAVGQADEAEHPDAGMILIARQPVAMLASPSADAKAMYGFPAGRPFRVIGREGNFTKIKDMRSGATGWIDTAALAPPPPRAPSVSAPSQTRPVGRTTATPGSPSAEPKPKATAKKSGGQVTAGSEPAAAPSQAQNPNRPGALFGRGGFFGGIFGGGN